MSQAAWTGPVASTGTILALGVWRSLVARSVRVGEAPSSNLGTPMSTGEPTGFPREPLLVTGMAAPRGSRGPSPHRDKSVRMAASREGAAAAYESLLADCYDQLHRFSKSVNGISSTSPHKSPAASIAALGAAYRASARTLPIFDTYGHDAYPEVS